MELYYRTTKKPRYISEFEDEELIDNYHKAIKSYCLYQLYLSMRKMGTAQVFKAEYAEQINILQSKKGKQRENRVPRKITHDKRPFRLRFQR